MLARTRAGGLPVAAAAVLMLLHATAWPQATAAHKRDIYTIENQHFRIEIDASAGGRLRSWKLKPGGRDMVALWKGRNEIGGALDDRAFFTSAAYRAAIMRPGPAVAVVRLEAVHPSGMGIVKRLTAWDDSPTLKVEYEFRNGTQASQRLFIRNFFLPGSHPQTDAHLYWVCGKNERTGKTVASSSAAAGYYLPDPPEYAALWDSSTGDGVMAYAPGVSKFYFWRGSKHYPTFEWVYEDIPAGQTLRAAVLLTVVTGSKTAPVWSDLVGSVKKLARPKSLAPLPGWVDEATRFGVTDAERARGFWLSIGADDWKQRPPKPWEVDLPLDDDRYLALALNTTKPLRAPIAIETPDAQRKYIAALIQTEGQDRRELLPIPKTPISLLTGGKQVLWLHVRSQGLLPGSHLIPLTLRVGDAAVPIPIQLRVWPVRVTAARPFHVRGYCGGFTVWTKGYDVTDEGLKHLEAILKAYAEIGGDVLDWNAVWVRLLRHAKIAGTDEIITDVAKATPQRIDLARLPQLDFSYFDPWLEVAKRYGVTRVETYMPYPTNRQLNWRLLDPAVGKGRVKPGTEDADKVIVWFYREMRRYFESKGFTGMFCKISDEIPPERIPQHIETAKLARAAGWRPFTTITGMIARTAKHIEAIDPYCDEWQLNFSLKDDFLALTQKRFTLEQQTHKLTCKWGRYRNGGARETWGSKMFGPGAAVPIDPNSVETFELLEDGKPLRRKGGSPWGNTDRGIVCSAGRLGPYLYISPSTGEPTEHRYKLKLTVRRESADGRPLVTIDPTDEVWCYGGGSRPFRRPYDSSWPYPIMTLYHGFRGYGLWAFYHWNKTERIMWIDPDTARVTISPAYCGYRDGWRDARLFAQLRQAQGARALAGILSADAAAILRVGVRSREAYRFTTVLNAADPVARNNARRRALELLSQ